MYSEEEYADYFLNMPRCEDDLLEEYKDGNISFFEALELGIINDNRALENIKYNRPIGKVPCPCCGKRMYKTKDIFYSCGNYPRCRGSRFIY